jgi:hypothetical protein
MGLAWLPQMNVQINESRCDDETGCFKYGNVRGTQLSGIANSADPSSRD